MFMVLTECDTRKTSGTSGLAMLMDPMDSSSWRENNGFQFRERGIHYGSNGRYI